MERGPLIGGALLAAAAVGIVGFYLVMSGGDTGDIPETTRQVHQVENLKENSEHEVVGQKADIPEDPVEAVIKGEWDTKQHGQVSGDDWDEIRAVQAQRNRAKMEGIIEAFIAPLDVDKAEVRKAFEDLQVKQEATNAEVREGWVSGRAARKEHEKNRKAAETKMVELLGQEKAEELRDKLAKQRLVFY